MGEVVLTERFGSALAWAGELHAEQRRHNSRAPYLTHLVTTAAIVLEEGLDEDVAVAALLHDAVEDQGVDPDEIRRRFGERVTTLVLDCTDQVAERAATPWADRKRAHLDRMREMSTEALRLIAADKVASLQGLLDDVDREGMGVFDRSVRSAGDLLRNYEDVLAVLQRRQVPGAGAARLARLAKALRELLDAHAPEGWRNPPAAASATPRAAKNARSSSASG